jgi:hypothetical protein
MTYLEGFAAPLFNEPWGGINAICYAWLVEREIGRGLIVTPEMMREFQFTAVAPLNTCKNTK